MANFARFSGRPIFTPYVKDSVIQGGEFVHLQHWWYDHPVVGRVLVERGFITDFASTPQLLHALPSFDPMMEAIYAALPHDRLYCSQEFPRAVCDQVLYDAMIDSGASPALARAYWLGVRSGGWWPWMKRKWKGGGLQHGDFVPSSYWQDSARA